jgi:hypothetical protein
MPRPTLLLKRKLVLYYYFQANIERNVSNRFNVACSLNTIDSMLPFCQRTRAYISPLLSPDSKLKGAYRQSAISIGLNIETNILLSNTQFKRVPLRSHRTSRTIISWKPNTWIVEVTESPCIRGRSDVRVYPFRARRRIPERRRRAYLAHHSRTPCRGSNSRLRTYR